MRHADNPVLRVDDRRDSNANDEESRGGRCGLVVIRLGYQEVRGSNPTQGRKIFTFQILLLERTFKSLTTFGENV